MKVPAAKIEKAPSKDQSRPILTSLFLRVIEPASETEPGSGFLEGTDSYKLARVPVTLDPGDTEGFVSVDSIAAARKANRHEPRILANGGLEVAGGPTFPRTLEGKFPDTDSLIPTEDQAWKGSGSEPWTIGLNAKFLYELAQSLGSETVRLSFGAPKSEERGSEFYWMSSGPEPSNLRPITVKPFGGKSEPDAIGLLMPIR